MAMTDTRRLPPAGRQQLADLFNRCEVHMWFPWQCTLAPIMLQPKARGGTGALALMTWFCRFGELLDRRQIRERATSMPPE
eukprot:5457643-Pyramimonas_sp.AAC.2